MNTALVRVFFLFQHPTPILFKLPCIFSTSSFALALASESNPFLLPTLSPKEGLFKGYGFLTPPPIFLYLLPLENNLQWVKNSFTIIFTPGPGHLLSAQLSSSLAYSSAVKMEATHSSEIIVKIYHTTSCHIQVDNNCHSHCCDNIISHSTIITSNHTHMHVCKHICTFCCCNRCEIYFMPNKLLTTVQL